MDTPYFATYTGCDDLYLVCQRPPTSTVGPVTVVGGFPTMGTAKAHAASRNITAYAARVDELATRGNQLGDTELLQLYETLTAYADMLRYECDIYRIERERDAAADRPAA